MRNHLRDDARSAEPTPPARRQKLIAAAAWKGEVHARRPPRRRPRRAGSARQRHRHDRGGAAATARRRTSPPSATTPFTRATAPAWAWACPSSPWSWNTTARRWRSSRSRCTGRSSASASRWRKNNNSDRKPADGRPWGLIPAHPSPAVRAAASRSAFARLFQHRVHLREWPLPKKPFFADNGEGCADFTMTCRSASISPTSSGRMPPTAGTRPGAATR